MEEKEDIFKFEDNITYTPKFQHMLSRERTHVGIRYHLLNSKCELIEEQELLC